MDKIFKRAYLPSITVSGAAALRGLALVVFQRPAQPFTTLNWAIRCTLWARPRKQEHITLSLNSTCLSNGTISVNVECVFKLAGNLLIYTYFSSQSIIIC
jgi:hypothetical protein